MVHGGKPAACAINVGNLDLVVHGGIVVLPDHIVDVGNTLGTDIVRRVEVLDDLQGRKVRLANVNFLVAEILFVHVIFHLN